MLRKLFTTTAAVAILTTAAAAQNATTTAPTGDFANQNGAIFAPEGEFPPSTSMDGFLTAYQGQILASTITGKRIYSGTAADAEVIGDVNDVVMSPDGNAEAVIAGIGGFLGIGEKEVAIDFQNLTWSTVDGELRLVASMSREQLESAPEFDRDSLLGEMQVGAAAVDGDDTLIGNDLEADTDVAVTTESETMLDADGNPLPVDDTTSMAENDPIDDDTMLDDEMAVADNPVTDNSMFDADVDNPDMQVAETETDPLAPGAAGNGMLREGMNEVALGALSVDELIGSRVYGASDEDLGEIDDVLLSADGQVEAYVIDVGGFLGIGEKPVALAAADLSILQDNNGELTVFTPFTEEQLDAQEAYDEDLWATDRNRILMR